MSIPLKVEDLSFSYPGREKFLLQGINLTVERGEILAIVGLSGSGKTSLCYCLSGIIPHLYQGEYSGKVFIEGKLASEMKLPGIATMLGVVFQNPENQVFFPVVEDELAFGPENLCLEREEIGKRIDRVISLLGIKEKRFEQTDHLSGGQKQLVTLASVLSLDPRILIFDESMSQIDNQGKNRIKEVILELKENGKTIIMVEHNIDNIEIADRKLVLKKGRLYDFEGVL